MQRLEVSGAVRPMYGSLGVKRLRADHILHVSRIRVYSNRAHSDRPRFFCHNEKVFFFRNLFIGRYIVDYEVTSAPKHLLKSFFKIYSLHGQTKFNPYPANVEKIVSS